MIKIDFEFQTDYGVYRDAIYLPENHNLSEQDISKLQEQRKDTWINHIVTASSQTSPVQVAEVDQAPEQVYIGDEIYQKLEGTPLSGYKLVEVKGVWYFKV